MRSKRVEARVYYVCSYHHRPGVDACPNGPSMPMVEADRAVLDVLMMPWRPGSPCPL
jgi:hypothetical protein